MCLAPMARCAIICEHTMLDRIIKLLAEFVLPIAGLTMFSFGAYTIWRQHWFRARPALSGYVWFQAIVGAGLFLLACFGTDQYTLCRISFVGYWAFVILTSFLSLAVVYEFLFCLNGGEKTIRKKAIVGFVIAESIAIAGAVALGSAATDGITVASTAGAFSIATALVLIFSSIYICAVKKPQPLFMNSRMAVVFWFLAFENFTDILISYPLRSNKQIGSLITAAIWVAFTIFLYWALKSGPPQSEQLKAKSVELG